MHKIDTKAYLEIFKLFQKEMPEYKETYFFNTHNKITTYSNSSGSYFTANINGYKEYGFKCIGNQIILNAEGNLYNDKIELLLIDAFEDAIKRLLKSNHKVNANFDNLIENLFGKLVQRRKLTNKKNLFNINNAPIKQYI